MAGFIIQVLASAVLLWNLHRQPVSPFSSYFACDLCTGSPVVLIEDTCVFLSSFNRVIGYYVETDQDSLALSRLKSFDVAILPFF